MYSRERIKTIRTVKCDMFEGVPEIPRLIYGGESSNFIETRSNHSSSKVSIPYKEDGLEQRNPSYFIEWNEEEGQFKVAPKK